MTNNMNKQNRNWLPLLLPAVAVLAIIVGLDHYKILGGNSDMPDASRAARSQRSSQPQPRGASTPGANSPNPLGGLALSDLSAITDRPLFEPSRRAYVVPAAPVVVAEVKTPPIDPNMFALIGVVTAKDQMTALIQHRASGRLIRLQQGGDIDGWIVAKIEQQAVTLQKSGAEITVSVFKK